MKKAQITYLVILAFFLSPIFSFGNSLNSNFNYNVETKTLLSEHKNILGQTAQQEVDDFFENFDTGTDEKTLTIKINFLQDLNTTQYSEKKNGNNLFYVVNYFTPRYEAIVLNAFGEIIFRKKYGGEKIAVEFGKDQSFENADALNTHWQMRKEIFYKNQEGIYNNVTAFIEDFKTSVLYDYWVKQSTTTKQSIVYGNTYTGTNDTAPIPDNDTSSNDNLDFGDDPDSGDNPTPSGDSTPDGDPTSGGNPTLGGNPGPGSDPDPVGEINPKPRTFGKFYIGLNDDPLGFPEGSVTGYIIDNSPTPDPLTISVLLNPTSRAKGFHLGYESSNAKKRTTWNFDLNFSFNEEGRMFLGNFGYGIRIGKQKFHVIPMARIGVGNASIKLGDIQNISSYIQINDILFYDNSVEARLKEMYVYGGPELNVCFPIGKRSGIQLSGTYKFTRSIKPEVKFTGNEISSEDEGTGRSATRDLGHSKNFIFLNNKQLDDNSKFIKAQG